MSLTVAAAEPRDAPSFYLRDGDRVVFYGDSITQDAHYTRAVEAFVRTRCPDMRVSFVNSGWAGERAWGGDGGMLAERLERDVIAQRPTVVTVLLGMNDGYYTNFDPTAVAAFKKSLETLIDTLTRALPDVRITLIGASPYDDVTPGAQADWEKGIVGGYNSVVSHFAEAAGEVAAKHGLLFVDMNQPLVDLMKRLQAEDAKLARQLIPDRIHPGSSAGLVMAARLLNAWDAPVGGQVITVDARKGSREVLKAQVELPLPFPCERDPLFKVVSRLSPDLKRFSPDVLRVDTRPFPRASLKIDGGELGTYSADELAAGIDLNELDTPAFRQATAVWRLISLRNEAHFTRWRNLELPFASAGPSNVRDAASRLAALEDEFASIEFTVATPQIYTLEFAAADK